MALFWVLWQIMEMAIESSWSRDCTEVIWSADSWLQREDTVLWWKCSSSLSLTASTSIYQWGIFRICVYKVNQWSVWNMVKQCLVVPMYPNFQCGDMNLLSSALMKSLVCTQYEHWNTVAMLNSVVNDSTAFRIIHKVPIQDNEGNYFELFQSK